MPKIGSVQAETEHFGKLSLDAFLARSDSYSQAYLVVHKGDIVYEQYPRMRREDSHLWMSSAKPTASLIIDMLISEGKIDEHKPITKYLTDFQGTDWDGITTHDVLDMATGAFEAGRHFDAIVVDAARPSGTIRLLGDKLSPEDILARIIYTASKPNIAKTIVGGRIVHAA